jgi:hypothetical protein
MGGGVGVELWTEGLNSDDEQCNQYQQNCFPHQIIGHQKISRHVEKLNQLMCFELLS